MSLERYESLAGVDLSGGYPSVEARQVLNDELYFQRATQVYLWSLPAVNMWAMKIGLEGISGVGYQVLSVTEQRLKPRTVITTPNSDVIYGMGFADLSETGPLEIIAPPKLQALLDDFWQQPLVGPTIDGHSYLGDIGIPGPDKGDGGKYLIVPDDYEGDLDTSDHYVYKSPTNGVFIFVRGFFNDPDDVAPGVSAVKGLVVRPYSGDAKSMEFPQISDIPVNAVFPNDVSYFDLLNDFVQSERLSRTDPYMNGMLQSLGIVKGFDFNPSQHERELLDLAAKTAWKMAKNTAANFDDVDKALWWEDRHWIAHVLTEQNDFMHTLLDEEFRLRTNGYTHLDAKAHMFLNHYSVSAGMMTSVVGLGAKYGNAYKDSEGNYLRGENAYCLNMPADPPAKLFWSLTIYDAQTAAGVDAAGQEFPSLNSMNDLVRNEDGSVTFFIAPSNPDGVANWLKTVPGRGWFGMFRFYGPEAAFFERQYKPGDFEIQSLPAS